MTRALAFALCLAGCVVPEQRTTPARELGAELFASPALSSSSQNVFSCATCHNPGVEDGRRIFPGAPLAGTALRKAYWGGTEAQLLAAVNLCVTSFMQGQPLQREDPTARALFEFLASTSPSPGNASDVLPNTIVASPLPLPNGDVMRGAEIYLAACDHCHGEKNTGDHRLAAVVPAMPEALTDAADHLPGGSRHMGALRAIRHGRFFGHGGTMPPFSTDRLSDADASDLISYLLH